MGAQISGTGADQAGYSGRQVRGILQRAVEYCRAYASNVRIDTAEDNKIMQHAIAKCGFQRCGIIYLENGDPRIAYAKHFSDQE